jgi:hypothetical protein
MLEAFCDSNNIKLIWSSWSNNITEEMENFLLNNFKHYVKDTARKQFPKDFEFLINPNTKEEMLPFYEMHNWKEVQCHKEQKEKYPEIFDHAYDYHKISGDWGPGAHWAHPGLHKHIHWAEFYFNILKNKGYR